MVAAPHNETSIARAGIAFDGYPSFVARGPAPSDDVYPDAVFRRHEDRAYHAARERRDALALITRERVVDVIRAAERALNGWGSTAPKIAVGGLNPHAGEGGVFGREEIDIINPAIETPRRRGHRVTGPFGADTMFHRRASTRSS